MGLVYDFLTDDRPEWYVHRGKGVEGVKRERKEGRREGQVRGVVKGGREDEIERRA